MARKIDLSGQRIGKLTVLSPAQTRISPCGSKKAYWLCKCDCGRKKEIAASSLLSGAVESCGCNVQKNTSTLNRTHGKSSTRLYRIWCAMKSRCNNKHFWEFENYGGRGIKVCKEWDESFGGFETWALSNGYSDTLTIDRIDNSLGYEPSNCRWVPKEYQSKNRRNSIRITAFGETLSPVEWSAKTGIPYSTIVYRYHNGLPPEKILRGGG